MKFYLLRISQVPRIVLGPESVQIYRYTLLCFYSQTPYSSPQRALCLYIIVPTTIYFLRAPKSKYLAQTSTLIFRPAYLTTYQKHCLE